ncbi:YjiK family protein [Salmonella enterica subsp. enterica]|nr:YjiK family protein [Salmonella enterica subsp. enterica]
MGLKRVFYYKSVLLTTALLIMAGVVILYFPETYYLKETGWNLTAEKEIPGVKGGLSGLTWNSDSGTLFAVTDHPSSVIELDTEGNVLRVILSDRDHDFEAIEYLGQNRYILARERERTLSTHCIERTTTELPLAVYTMTLDINRGRDNTGFEGLASSSGRDELIIAQEKKPLRIYRAGHSKNGMMISDAITWETSLPWFIKDISGLHYDHNRQCLYILSHESALVLVSNLAGNRRLMPLLRGHYGLHRDIPQAEGIASDDRGTLWIVSEPNLFYRFSRTTMS